MTTPLPDKLSFWYASKYLSSDGDTITQQTADSGTVTTIVDAALTEADDYWNGAVGWFDNTTTTVALQGKFFHVRDFDAASDTLTLARDLPAAPAAGDTYRLIIGGNYRGGTEVFGMLADGQQPERETISGANITGLTIKYLSALLLEDTLSVFYDFSEDNLQIKMGSENYGLTLDVSGDVTDAVVFGEDGVKYALVDVTAASLPGSDQTDTWALTYPDDTFVPPYQGYETNTGANKTRYRLLVVRNDDTVESMQNLTAFCDKPAGTDTAIATGESLGTVADTVEVDDASDHPTTSYWVYNSTQDDVRFVFNRSGNVLNCAAAGGGLRGKTSAAWNAADVIEVYPDFDIGLDAPSTLQFENPATEETAPSGVTFSAPTIAENGLSIGTLAIGAIYGVWYRETIVDGARGRTDLIFDSLFEWD